jgi:hypothetical protein
MKTFLQRNGNRVLALMLISAGSYFLFGGIGLGIVLLVFGVAQLF